MDRYFTNISGREYEQDLYGLLIDRSKKSNIYDELHGYLSSKHGLHFKGVDSQSYNDLYENSVRKFSLKNSKEKKNKKIETRKIQSSPERILSAKDYNVLDWCYNGIASIALKDTILLWEYTTGQAKQLYQTPPGNNYEISCVKWSEGPHKAILAVGQENSEIKLFDEMHTNPITTLKIHSSRVDMLSWNNYLLSSSSSDKTLCISDVRQPSPLLLSLSSHNEEVCSVSWSPDHIHLSSGGNDGKVILWDIRNINNPLLTLNNHKSAVKAIAWSKWEDGLMATGGGRLDGVIRLWNIKTGKEIKERETGSQICGLAFAPADHELLSIHGSPLSPSIIWKVPSLEEEGILEGHTGRVLHLSLSPLGDMALTGSADETIRLWNVFRTKKEVEEEEEKEERAHGRWPVKSEFEALERRAKEKEGLSFR